MKARFAFSMLILALMLGFLTVNNSFASITFEQLSVYDLDQHYTTSGVYPDDFDDASEASADSKPDQLTIGALKRGAGNVPILKVVVTGEPEGTTYLESLTLVYTGNRVSDLGTYATIYKATYHPNGDLESASLVKESSIAGGTVTFGIPPSTIPAGETKNYIIVLDIAPGAGSYDVDLRVKAVNGSPETGYIKEGAILGDADGNIGVVGNPDPLGYAHIDATAPGLIVTAGVTPSYDLGTKILTLRFSDGGGIGTITNPRVNVIDDDAGDTAWKVDLGLADLDEDGSVDDPRVRIRATDDSPSIALTGASLMYYQYDTVEGWKLVAIPSDWEDADEGMADQAPGSKPDFLADEDYYGVVRIKLTPAQDAFIQDTIFPEDLEIYMNGALMDYQFDNAIGEIIQPLHYEGDITPPWLVKAEDKPVKFDYETRVLTLDFKESIDAADTDLSKIYIMNYEIEEFELADGNTVANPVIDTSFVMDLLGADITDGYGTTLTLRLTSAQRDVLKGDHSQLYLDAGAVRDIAGNPNGPLNSAIVAGSVDEFIDDIEDLIDDLEVELEAAATDEDFEELKTFIDDNINAANVCVTPALLSGVETVYDGDQYDYPDAPGTLVLFDLKFTEELSTDVNVTKITITNEKDEAPFHLSSSEYEGIATDGNGLARIARFELTKSHRDKISLWQRDGMKELHVRLDAGAVKDIYGTPNELMAESERIDWDKDTFGPALTNSSTYSSSTRLLKLRFNENVDLTPEAPETLDDLVDSKLITLGPPSGVTGVSFRLTDDELVLNQTDSWWMEYTLTSAHNDEISSWKADGATEINIKVEVGAVRDINENAAVLRSSYITAANWYKDTVRPTFASAYYAVESRTLVIRFSESISDATGLKPDLDLIKVHAAGKTPVALGTDTYEVSGEALKMEGLSDDADEAITDTVNPQVDIGAKAVYDLAGNYIYAISNRSITYTVGGPELSTTGNTYEHIYDEDETPPNQGLLTVTFKDVIDVSTLSLSKVKLEAGTTRISLSGATKLTKTDARIIEIEITDGDTLGDIAGLQSEFDTLYVRLEAGAVADLAGNENLEDYQMLEKWIGDTTKPEIDLRASYYIHDKYERGEHYARLVLKFDEPMDTRPAYIDASGIVVTDGGTNMVTLTLEEIKPGQGFSKEIQFNLTDAHRDSISFWAEPKVIGTPEVKDAADVVTTAASTDPPGIADTGGLTKTALSIYLAEDSVTDRAGNSVIVLPIAKPFAKAAAYVLEDPDDGIDEREYDSDLAADIDNEEGTDYSSWEKDLKLAEFVSGAYNANTKKLTITFDEWMDVKPVGIVDSKRIRIYDADYPSGDYVDLAGDATENEKTKTIEVTLTTEKDVAVKELKTPLYISLRSDDKYKPYPTAGTDTILDVGPARDIAGNPCAIQLADTDTKISYTTDTTKPTIVRSNGDDTTYRHKGKDFGAPDDITGLLSLVFNEGVDKNYNAINASKIRLSTTSSGGGFALTQEEIHTAPGYRVYPLATSYVHIIQFDLNDAHWTTVADEKWSTMYIQMQAGAVKDTSGNAIAAVTMDIHGDMYHTDDVGPDVRVPAAFIATASVGQDTTITAPSITDDSPITEVRLYYQAGGSVRTYVAMENTTGDTYVGTIPGSAVTNKGLCYYVWAVDLWDNTNITPNGYVKMREADLDEWFLTPIPGGFNVKVTGASVELPANTLPAFDAAAVPSTYRMLSVPITASPAATSATLFTPFGTAGVDWMAWKYTGGTENNGYQAGHITPFTFSPGVAAWVGTVNADKALTVAGDTSQISDKLSDDADQDIDAGGRYKPEIELHAGWNQIGCPYNFSRNWDKDTILDWSSDNIKDEIYWFTGEKGSYSFASLESTVPNQDVFATSWTGSGIPDNALVWNSWPGSLDPWGGYWIYSNREGAKLKIDPTVPGKGVLPGAPTAPAAQMPYNWSVKVMPEASGISGTAKFAGIVSDATDGIDKYDVMDLPALPGQVARLSFITEDGDYLQDMKAPADEMFWHFKVSSAANTPVTLKFEPSAVPSEYRTVLVIDTVTEAATDLRKVASYAYKSSEKIKNFKLIISKAHPETYIVPKRSVLLQNYPNPFNPETWVPYRLAKSGDVKVDIYNVAGQLVRTLELGYREAGSYTVKERAAYWDGRNNLSERIASGVYFYHIQSGSFHATKRMVIVK